MIKLLEENGIGRPSTYATIIRTIQDREYVHKEQNKLLPTELGFTVNDFLVGALPELFNIGFTAGMEQKLDDVEEGTIHWGDMMQEFYNEFSPWLEQAKDSGAPPSDQAANVLALFNSVTFDEKQKIGRRIFDDARFVDSIQQKFSSSGKMSDKQFQALLVMAAKYSRQIGTQISQLPAELQELINDAAEKLQEKQEAESQRPPIPENGGYEPVFSAFENVVFPEAKSGRYSFDEGKFFKSLKKQALSGKALSEKQLSALKKLVLKYKDQLTEPATVFATLQMDIPEAVDPQNDPAAKAKDLIEKLSTVTQWSTPVAKGRFAFDEKKFYQSVKKQFTDGKILSPKQLAALEKLAAKYIH